MATTNYDKIRNMSIDEMAAAIDNMDCYGGILDEVCLMACPEQNCNLDEKKCIDCIRRWLESEAE